MCNHIHNENARIRSIRSREFVIKYLIILHVLTYLSPETMPPPSTVEEGGTVKTIDKYIYVTSTVAEILFLPLLCKCAVSISS